MDNLASTKIGIRGGREIARGLFCIALAAVVVGLILLVPHVSLVAVVIGVLLIIVGVGVVVLCSKKRIA